MEKNSQEYYIYDENEELQDVVSFTKKEAASYKKKFPDYILEPVDIDYTNED